MIKKEELRKVYDRAGGFCECGCGRRFVFNKKYPIGKGCHYHHIYFKSEYRGDDRDLARNLAFLADVCHIPKIHEKRDKELDKRLKYEADLRLPPEQRSENKVERKEIVYGAGISKYDKEKARKDRKQQEERFKKSHEGLTPSQRNYRQNKKLLKKDKQVNKSGEKEYKKLFLGNPNNQYKESVEYFKKTHNGLTPSKYQYQQSKLYLKRMNDKKMT